MFRRLFSMLVLFSVALTACSPNSAPRVISTFPQNAQSYSPPNLSIVYNVSLEVLVRDRWAMEFAASSVQARAEQLSGYLVSADNQQDPFDDYIRVTVAVPPEQFETMRHWIKGQGTVASEQVSGDWQPTEMWRPGAGYSQLTVTFRQNGWGQVGAWVMVVIFFIVGLIPPALMLIGFITVLRLVIRWVSNRRKPTPTP